MYVFVFNTIHTCEHRLVQLGILIVLSLLKLKCVRPSVHHLHSQLPTVTVNMSPMERMKRASLSVNCQNKGCHHVNHLFIVHLFPGLWPPYRIQCNSSSNRSPYRIQCNSSSNRSPYRIQCNSSSNRSPYRI